MHKLVILGLLSIMAALGIAIAPSIEAQRLQGFNKDQIKGVMGK